MGRAPLIFLIAFASTLVGSMSGGSSSLLTTPSWIAMGFPLPVAVACDKVAGALWTALGSRNYLRSRRLDLKLLIPMIVLGVAAALAGTRANLAIDPRVLERAVGGMIVVVVLVVAVVPRFGLHAGPARIGRVPVALAALPLGFYEGLFGSGNSIAATLLFTGARGFDLPEALGHYYVLACVWCGAAAIAYITAGYFDLGLCVPLVLGATAGGYLGSRIGSARGPRFIRVIFVIAGLVLGLKLLLGR
ncbi:MAG: sulfite exporter TauE/SafE family protein [Gemmatimonadota bacterium]